MNGRAAFLLVAALAGGAVSAKPIALLVGVGDYRDAQIRDLAGPPHDVAELKRLLISRHGFAAEDVRTLVDAQAGRAGILAELDQLERRSQPGDLVFVYFSGHGTSAHDPAVKLPLPYTGGAFIPWDVNASGHRRELMQSMIIGNRDLLPRFSALERGGRQLRVFNDSCYSGQAVRSLGRLPTREFTPPGLLERDEYELSQDKGNRPPAPPYPYRQVVYMAAASDNEKAVDIGPEFLKRYPTLDGKPHGAFTDALLRALSGNLAADLDRDGGLSNGEVFEAVSRFMEQRGHPHRPQLLPSSVEDANQLARAPVLGGAAPAVAANMAPAREEGGVEVTLESAPETWRPLLRELPGLKLAASPAALRIRAEQGGDWGLYSAAGDLMLRDSRPEILVRRLKGEVWLRGALARGDGRKRFLVALEADPAHRGGNFMAGETLAFSLRSDQAGRLLLLNLESSGGVSLLYPYLESELAPLPARQTRLIPGAAPQDRIKVTPPFGVDQLLAIVLPPDENLPVRLRGRTGLSLDDPDLQRLARLLEGPAEYGIAAYAVRTRAVQP